jgi:phage terminase large subunit-like protein
VIFALAYDFEQIVRRGQFIPVEWWDACVDPDAKPLTADRRLSVWVGVDASTKRDSTAIVVTTYDPKEKCVRLVWHRIFQPSPDDPLHFEATIEQTLIHVMARFLVQEVRFDPWQMQSVSQRLIGMRIPMVEFGQTVQNLTEASQNLYELVKGRNLILYEDAAMRLALQRSIAIESTRGWRIAKEKASHKIDVIVALAQSALGAVESASRPVPMRIPLSVLARVGQPGRYTDLDPRYSHDVTRGRRG